MADTLEINAEKIKPYFIEYINMANKHVINIKNNTFNKQEFLTDYTNLLQKAQENLTEAEYVILHHAILNDLNLTGNKKFK